MKSRQYLQYTNISAKHADIYYNIIVTIQNHWEQKSWCVMLACKQQIFLFSKWLE